MKKILGVLSILTVTTLACKKETTPTIPEVKKEPVASTVSCNYITDYYQKVYKAELSFWDGSYTEAYTYLKDAESHCPLLNQVRLNEPYIMAEVLVRLGKLEEAFPYIERMLKEGYGFDRFENNEAFEPLLSFQQWEDLKTKEIDYLVAYRTNLNFELRKEIVQMNADDQAIRTGGASGEVIARVDSAHQARIKEIFETYGYPGPMLVGNESINEQTGLGTLFLHLEDTTYFKPILKKYIEDGKAPADILANMLDSQQTSRGIFDYGIYENVDSMRITNYKKLDSRRISVGLPPRAITKRKDSFIRSYYKALQ